MYHPQHLKIFDREVSIMMLQLPEHPSVVSPVDVIFSTRENSSKSVRGLILPFAPYGALCDFLCYYYSNIALKKSKYRAHIQKQKRKQRGKIKRRAHDDTDHDDNNNNNYEEYRRSNSISKRPVVDVTKHAVPKISSFGSAFRVGESKRLRFECLHYLNDTWNAPELLDLQGLDRIDNNDDYNPLKGDIFSLGVLWRYLQVFGFDEGDEYKCGNNDRSSSSLQSLQLPSSFKACMERCLQEDSSKRPSIEEIIRLVNNIEIPGGSDITTTTTSAAAAAANGDIQTQSTKKHISGGFDDNYSSFYDQMPHPAAATAAVLESASIANQKASISDKIATTSEDNNEHKLQDDRALLLGTTSSSYDLMPTKQQLEKPKSTYDLMPQSRDLHMNPP
eukprot:jgi/Bigna1/90487/estExt_fgenesh1_pg.C_710084